VTHIPPAGRTVTDGDAQVRHLITRPAGADGVDYALLCLGGSHWWMGPWCVTKRDADQPCRACLEIADGTARVEHYLGRG
jgi:hypothetical protein